MGGNAEPLQADTGRHRQVQVLPRLAIARPGRFGHDDGRNAPLHPAMQPHPDASTSPSAARLPGGMGAAPPWAESLGAVLPGIVHLLGNLMFTIQGNAHLSADTPQGQAIGRAAHRGAEVVRLLGCLLGDAAPQSVPADDLLHLLAELARVTLRDRNCQVHAEAGEDPPGPRVDLQRTAQATLLGLQQFVAGLPTTTAGTVTLQRVPAGESHAASAALRLRFAFVPAEGMLPFPVAGPELLGNVLAASRRAGVRLAPMVRGNALELDLPAGGAGAGPRAEA